LEGSCILKILFAVANILVDHQIPGNAHKAQPSRVLLKPTVMHQMAEDDTMQTKNSKTLG